MGISGGGNMSASRGTQAIGDPAQLTDVKERMGDDDRGRPSGAVHGHLRLFWRAVQIIARKVGEFQARVILSILYLVLVGPYALVLRLFADPLRLRPDQTPHWLARERPVGGTVGEARRQF